MQFQHKFQKCNYAGSVGILVMKSLTLVIGIIQYEMCSGLKGQCIEFGIAGFINCLIFTAG